MNALLERKEKSCTAFFSDNDAILQGALYALREKGISVEVPLIGFEDSSVPDEPFLPAAGGSKRRIGKLAVLLLMSMIGESQPEPVKIKLGTRFRD